MLKKRFFFPFLLLLSTVSFPFAYLPSRFEVIESANERVMYTITLISNKSVTEEIDLSLSAWDVTSDQVMFYPFTDDWVRLSASHITLASGETHVLSFSVTVPSQDGEQRFEINFTSEMANSSFRFSKSIPIYLVTAGTEKMGCQIISFDILQEGDSLKTICLIENVGNVHIRPRIEIKHGGASSWIRMQDDIPVYPYSRRRFVGRVPWPESIKEGEIVSVRLQYYDAHNQLQTILKNVVVF